MGDPPCPVLRAGQTSASAVGPSAEGCPEQHWDAIQPQGQQELYTHFLRNNRYLPVQGLKPKGRPKDDYLASNFVFTPHGTESHLRRKCRLQCGKCVKHHRASAGRAVLSRPPPPLRPMAGRDLSGPQAVSRAQVLCVFDSSFLRLWFSGLQITPFPDFLPILT